MGTKIPKQKRKGLLIQEVVSEFPYAKTEEY